MIKSNPIPTGGQPTNWRTIILKKLSHCCEGSKPHIRLPAWDSSKGTGNPQGIWPWRPAGFDYRASIGLGGTETLLLEGTNKRLHTHRPRAQEQRPHPPTPAPRRWNEIYWIVLEGLLRSRGSSGVSPPGRGHWRQQSWKTPQDVNPLGAHH